VIKGTIFFSNPTRHSVKNTLQTRFKPYTYWLKTAAWKHQSTRKVD